MTYWLIPLLHLAQATVAAIGQAEFEDILLKVIGALTATIMTWVGLELRGIRRRLNILDKLSVVVLGADGNGGPGSLQYEVTRARDRYHDTNQDVTEHGIAIPMLQQDVQEVKERVGALEDRERERWGNA